MKIYNKTDFFTGIACACALPLFALGVIHAGWWQYFITIALAARFLYLGLSKTASERERTYNENFKETAISIYGRFYFIRTALPWLLTLVYFPVALLLRFAFHVFLPVWPTVLFAVILTVSVFYSVGVIRRIKEEIDLRTSQESGGGS